MTRPSSPRTVALKDGTTAVIRRVTPEDVGPFVTHRLRAALDYGKIATEPDEVETDLERQKEFLARWTSSEEGLLLCATVGGEMAAMLGLHPIPFKKCRHVRDLGMSVVDPWKGLGLGTALLGEAVEWARSHPGVFKLTLQVFDENEAALALYRRAGFVEEGRLRAQYRFRDGSYHDAVVMRLFVKERGERP